MSQLIIKTKKKSQFISENRWNIQEHVGYCDPNVVQIIDKSAKNKEHTWSMCLSFKQCFEADLCLI